MDFPKTCPDAAVSLPSCLAGGDEAYDTSTRARNGLPSGLKERVTKAREGEYNRDVCCCKERGFVLLLPSSRSCDCVAMRFRDEASCDEGR